MSEAESTLLWKEIFALRFEKATAAALNCSRRRCRKPSAVDVAKRFAKFGADIVHAGVEGFHHHEPEEFAGIGDDQVVGIFRIVLDCACNTQTEHFFEKGTIKIDTVLGTLENPSPVALGQVFDTQTHAVVGTFYRGGVQERLEKLMIGTVYSNYEGRNLVLSGTAELIPEFCTLTDKSEPGKYVVLQETQRLRDEESNIKMVQFSEDHFEGVRFK